MVEYLTSSKIKFEMRAHANRVVNISGSKAQLKHHPKLKFRYKSIPVLAFKTTILHSKNNISFLFIFYPYILNFINHIFSLSKYFFCNF